jgi:Mn2+/Fe2+ NRAMP family transporter
VENALSLKTRLTALGPGLLVAATGVGAGDLATAAFSGNKLGLAVLWAVVFGAALKFVLNEGLARWQLATGETLLEGVFSRCGDWSRYLFLGYLACWGFFVGSALIGACGVAATAIAPLGDDPLTSKIVWGILHSAAGVALVRAGGYRLFEKIMAAGIGLMFLTVTATAVLTRPDWAAVARGLFVPNLPAGGLAWTVALIGGIGGTVTVLCYGYWIREEGRSGEEALSACRWDLAAGYAMTAVFGIAMVVIGSTTEIDGRGAGLLAALADRLGESLGAFGRVLFLTGAWAAIASSLLGVWQSVPYLFADAWRPGSAVDTGGRLYRGGLYALATVPALGLWLPFREAQKLYAIVGAAFMPLLALALLWLNGAASRVGPRMKNGPLSAAALALVLGFFLFAAWIKLGGGR